MKRTHSAFTLVELLVVITIIGILMGLLIPAINAAREVARRNQCATQQKNFALAAIQFENTKGRFPGYVQDYGLFRGGGDPSDPSHTGVPRHKKIGTWAVAILPWLDAQPTYEHWTQDRYPIIVADPASPPDSGATTGVSGEGFHTLAAPNLAIFQCPSNPVSEGDDGKNSYIYNNGMCHQMLDTSSPPVFSPISWSGTPFAPPPAGKGSFAASQDRDNGVGNCKYNVVTDPSGNLVHQSEGPKVRLDDLKDGQGFTILFSENVQAFPWHRPGLIDGSDLDMSGAPATETDIAFTVESARYIHGMVWHYEDIDASTSTFPWNRHGGSMPRQAREIYSFHRINGGGTTVSDDIFTKTIQSTSDARNLARPSSAHVDGVNCGFADGATRFVSQTIDYRVYQALMTPRGKSSGIPWPEFVLTDELGE
jgi:prepilin-type N-terminal cleavage/methylation domain-containing protein